MSKRSYRQNCALARASDVIGERWTLLLLRDLLVFPRRFKELLASLKGIGTNLLTSRLKDLETAEIIQKQIGESGESRYAVTDRGRALEPALLAMIRWGLLYGPENQDGDHHRDDWDLLALKALFQRDRAMGLTVRVQFRSPTLLGWVVIDQQTMTVGLGDLSHTDLQISATVSELFLRAQQPGELLLAGSEDTLQQFMSSFAMRA